MRERGVHGREPRPQKKKAPICEEQRKICVTSIEGEEIDRKVKKRRKKGLTSQPLKTRVLKKGPLRKDL